MISSNIGCGNDDVEKNKAEAASRDNESLIREMYFRILNIEEMHLRHSEDRKHEVRIINDKLDGLQKTQRDDKEELVEKIHLVQIGGIEKTNTVSTKLASIYGGVAIILTIVINWLSEHLKGR
jgi:hypothetical protein